MRAFSAKETRRQAVRDLLVSLGALSAFGGIPFYFFATSPVVPEPLKSGIIAAMAAAWIALSFGALLNLRRDLIPVRLLDEGIQAGSRFVPYADIHEVDSRPGVIVFRLRLQGRKFYIYLSKIGIASEEAFFEELNRRIEEARLSGGENSVRGPKSFDLES